MQRAISKPLGIALAALVLANALAAQRAETRVWESNFGHVILANSDIVVLGIAAAQRTQVNGAVSVEITLQQVLYGEEKSAAINVVLSDASVLRKGAAVEGLFALKRIAGRGYTLVGKPEEAASGDEERDLKLRVARQFIALEAKPEGNARTQDYLDLLDDHLRQTSYAAQNAAIELKLWVQRRPEVVTREAFDRFAKTFKDLGVPKSKVRADLYWALAAMVECKVKSDEFKQVRRGKTTDRTKAIESLVKLREDYSAAFGEADARLCDALAKDDGVSAAQAEKLKQLGEAIRAEIKRLDEIRKREGKPVTETREVPHAEGKLPVPGILPAPPPQPKQPEPAR